MGIGKQSVVLKTPDGRTIDLNDAINLARQRAIQTGLLTGLGGHTIDCEVLAIEVSPECYSCRYFGGFSEDKSKSAEPCKLGVSQNEGRDMSERYNQTDQYCEKYEIGHKPVCNCGLTESLQ